MRPSSENTKFIPLLGVLKQVQFWLESARPPQIMLVAPTMEEFNSQKLPPHCKVTKRKIRGSRIPVLGRQRQNEEFHSTLAHWPEDALVEPMRSALIVVLNGEPKLRFVDYNVQCQPGDFIIAPAQLPRFSGKRPPHEEITVHSHFELIIIFYGHPDAATFTLRLCHFRNGEDGPAKKGEACWIKTPLLSHILVGLEKYLQKDNEGKCAQHLLTSFVMLLLEHIGNGEAFDSVLPSDSLSIRHQDPIEMALEYIRNHLDKPLSIDTVARWVGLSRSVFTRQFRVATNQSFTAYLTQQRIEHAKVLLIKTNFPIVRVSEKSGLLPGRLSQLFREYCQCSPSEYRRAQRKVQNTRD